MNIEDAMRFIDIEIRIARELLYPTQYEAKATLTNLPQLIRDTMRELLVDHGINPDDA